MTLSQFISTIDDLAWGPVMLLLLVGFVIFFLGHDLDVFLSSPHILAAFTVLAVCWLLAAPIEMDFASPFIIGTCFIFTPGIVTASFNKT